MKKGNRFLHSKWFNSRFSLDEIKQLSREETALEFEITAIRRGVCYYRAVYKFPDREEHGGAMKHPLNRMYEIVLKMTN